MADYAHTETDKAIEELEKRLQAEYRQAYRETKGKLEKYLSDFAQKDEAKRKLLDEGKILADDYKKWRTNQMLTGKRWQAMVDTLAKDMNNTNQIAADIISGQLSPTFALNANYAEYMIEEGFRTDYGFTLYNEGTVNRLVAENPDLLPAPSVDIPADIRWNKQKITSNITQAVLQGKSIPEIAKTMQTVVGMNKASATRNARTAMTGAQNAGRQATYDKAKAMGIKVKKEWIATLDGRTRHSHGMADGQQVELDGKFTVGRAKMRYPGDVQNGTPEEIYNCRCTIVTREPPEILQGEQPRMTYQEWVQTKEGQETLEKARIDHNKKAAKRRKVKKKEQNNTQNSLKLDGKSDIINKAKSVDMFNDYDVSANSLITAQNIINELNFTSIGRQTLKDIENLPERIKLTSVNKSDNIRGEQFGSEIVIYLCNCVNVKWAARTIIHEITHYKYGIGYSQWAECVCVAQELKHARNRDYLTISELRTIIKAVKNAYPEYNWRKDGFINGRRKSHR